MKLRYLLPIFLMLAVSTCATATQVATGTWSGGVGQIDGDQPHWAHFAADLTISETGLSGVGQFTEGESRYRGMRVELAGTVDEQQLTLSVQYGGLELACEGTISYEEAVATCESGSSEFDFRIVRREAATDAAIDQITGTYTLAPDHRIQISRTSNRSPFMLDLKTGEFRRLFSKKQRRLDRRAPRARRGTPAVAHPIRKRYRWKRERPLDQPGWGTRTPGRTNGQAPQRRVRLRD